MRPEIPFVEFPKISRFRRSVVVTEKIDGTNAQVYIPDDGAEVYAGSRTRWITPEDDNFGFARWVRENREDLLKLGPGSHFGEWWGHRVIYYSMTRQILDLLAAGETPEEVGPKFNVDPYVIKMHRDNGLWAECAASGDLLAAVDRSLSDFLATHAPKAQLAGSTVSFDRGFMAYDLPLAHDQLHYRNLDATSINEFMRRSGELALKVHDLRPRPAPESTAHRAMADIEQSLRIACYYRSVIASGLTAKDNEESLDKYCDYIKTWELK